MVGVIVGLLIVFVRVWLALTASDGVAEGPAVGGIIVFVCVGEIVFVLVGWAAAVCEAITFAVMATTVGICSSGIKVGIGSACNPNEQPLIDPSAMNSTTANATFIPDRIGRFVKQGESNIAGGIFFNNR